MGDGVTFTRGLDAISHEKTGDGDALVVEEVALVVGESPVFQELLEALFERLRCVRVLDLPEKDGDELVVRDGVVYLDDDIGPAAVQGGVVLVSGECFESGAVIGESVGIADELRMGRSLRGIEWFVEAKVADTVVMNFDPLVLRFKICKSVTLPVDWLE